MTTVQASADRPSTDADHRLDVLLLERWERDPGLPAIVSGDTVLTVGELRERVLRTAAALRAHGVRAGDRVVIHHERSVEFVVAVLGAMFAGAAHAALGVDDPPQRILRSVRDCAPRAVLTNSELRDRFSEAPGLSDLVVLTDEECATYPPTPEPVRDAPGTSADDPVAVIHTSGSTGRPKASLLSHRALVSRITALQTTHRMDERDRMIHHTVCTFDMYLGELYWPLLAGATIVVAAPGRHRDADHLAELIRDQGITTVYFGVSQLELFLLTRDPAERYDGLRQVLTGGEPLGPDLVRRFHSRSTASLTNIYGPSECTIYCTAWVLPRDPDLDTVLIGPAIQDTELWILDENGVPVAEGEPGELHIGGAGVALGYLNRPELTAERFLDAERLPHVPAVSPGGRLYRSGDLVRARPDGALEFLGRADRQVKIRGIRIEPGEIEETAKRCTGVGQAAVVAHGSGPEKRLAAFVVPEKGTEPGSLPSSVREALRTWLPPYMVPSAVEVVDELPLTPNGKLDRRLLETRAAKRSAESAPARPVRHVSVSADPDVESIVSEVWCEVLQVSEVGRDDDFFDLGGDSFKVLRVVETLRERLRADIPLAALLLEPTVGDFSEELRRIMAHGPTD
ncbi:amino acid adenylation domain-containing protein [Streptomyces sp. NPDC050988]|uniref:amino acid adenylation domain-containing protein n=1 Tax=Streptomyces sp. NPDC050988 TaxID=3365637 RepID=UPI0037B55B5E